MKNLVNMALLCKNIIVQKRNCIREGSRKKFKKLNYPRTRDIQGTGRRRALEPEAIQIFEEESFEVEEEINMQVQVVWLERNILCTKSCVIL